MSVEEVEVATAFKAISVPSTPIVSHSEAELGILDLSPIVLERGSTRWRRSQRAYSYRYSAEGCDTGFHDFSPLGRPPVRNQFLDA